ncbi:MAG: N-succinylarginine dihydrolase, partial [Chlamydiales bacterium]
SMMGGGGPACLRFRTIMTEQEKEQVHPFLFLTPSLYKDLTKWVDKHYREALHASDLADPLLLKESQEALDHLTQLLHLPSFYSFQC